MKLYSYFRSSAAYRVRIALNAKGIAYETAPVHLLRHGGEQLSEAYKAINPSALVPSLDDNGVIVRQSLAIIEYLDEAYPDSIPLLPTSPRARAAVRAMAMDIACDIHPLNNLRVLRYLSRTLSVAEEGRNDWYKHWIVEGLLALEEVVARHSTAGRFCYEDGLSLADVCLIPQLANARRCDCDLTQFPALMAIEAHCLSLAAFQEAMPDNQPDAE
ncbi:maleylacetoacetate isomerase [Paenalcaligenes niemegkensis]|uniref:maleylacetoacetate isomerase n=1 Tax=Paenalcaligenes niemegkensis TaxID=2895469 RepID=UPI001EE966E7|nr:maleylacetoacetate isomerase [Paenalcaligenes niemegkensis]MCQ9616840.1 maleylacetoacetate isomerase [Paenalcaligenes niemegkensis]